MSRRIARRFKKLKNENKKAFIVYICAGDPDIDTTVDLVLALDRAGVDIIELGIPYSDPMADGPANQAASERALASGTTLVSVLDAVRRIREKSSIPILFFTYMNPVIAYGINDFARDAHDAGVDGILPLDMPPEEDKECMSALRQAGLATVCLSAPNTSPERKRYLAKKSKGFLYYVCRLGVTGERAHLPDDLQEQVADLKKENDIPVCVGFGISSPEQAAEAAHCADGVIVGSHLVRLIENSPSDQVVERVFKRAAELAAAVHEV